MKNIQKIMCGIFSILMFSNGYTKALTREVLSNIGQYLTLLVNLVLEKDLEENILNKVCEHRISITCKDCIQKKSEAKKHMYILGIFSLMHLYSAVERTYRIYTNSKVKPGDKTSQCSDLGIILQGINGAGYLFSLPAISDGTDRNYYCIWAYLGYQNLADAYLRFCEKRQNSEKSSDSEVVNEPRKVETNETQTPKLEAKEMQEPEVEANKMQEPEVETREMQSPEVETKEIQAPEIETREMQAPEIETREMQEPELKANKMQEPEVETKEV